jgi:hypothetical protein
MEEKFFKRWYNLKYVQEEIEVAFNSNKKKNIKKYSRIITTIIFLASCLPSIEISFLFEFFEQNNFKMIMCLSYFVNFVTLIMTVTTFLSNNTKVFKIIIYIEYYFIVFIFLNIRYPLVHFLNYDIAIMYLLMWIDAVLRFLWMILEINTFSECFVLNGLSIISIWVLYAPVGDSKTLQRNMILLSTYSSCLIIVILFGNIIERHRKKAFYFQYKAERKAQWLDNVLDNMKTGILSIKGEKISYINKYFEKFLDVWIDYSKKIDPVLSSKLYLIFNKFRQQIRFKKTIICQYSN